MDGCVGVRLGGEMNGIFRKYALRRLPRGCLVSGLQVRVPEQSTKITSVLEWPDCGLELGFVRGGTPLIDSWPHQQRLGVSSFRWVLGP